jgi:lipoprotein-anchoring transpeptidase ErfK/SrfK
VIDTNQSTGDKPAAGDVRAWLRRGILAARAGDRGEARRCFAVAREAEPDNIVALLWSAWLAPALQESIALLIRVLELDPKNEHAHGGLRWARRRPPSGAEPPDAPPSDGPGGGDSPPDAESSSDPSALRDALRSSDVQEGARKGAVAQRARRLIGPLGLLLAVACLLILAGMALVTWYSAASVLASLPHLATESPAALAADTPTPGPTFTVAPRAQPPVKADTPLPTAAPTETSVPTKTPAPTATLADTPTPTPRAQPPVGDAQPPVETDTPVPAPSATAAPTFTPSPAPSATTTSPPPSPSPGATETPAASPSGPGASGEKWIDVDLTKQQLTAYQGNAPVFQALVSTGLPGTPTVVGQFRIYWKLLAADMAGPGYYLPAVPYTMYFLRGYSLHGTYWHHNFGHPMSHGCVNLRTEDAKWLFDWTDPLLPAGATQVQANGGGTLVVVHY